MVDPNSESLKSLESLPRSLALMVLILIMINIGCSVPAENTRSAYDAARSSSLGIPVAEAPHMPVRGRSILIYGPDTEMVHAMAKNVQTDRVFNLLGSAVIPGRQYAIVDNLPPQIDGTEASQIPELKIGRQQGQIGIADSLSATAASDHRAGDKLLIIDPQGNIVRVALLDAVGIDSVEVQALDKSGSQIGPVSTSTLEQTWIERREDEQVLRKITSMKK